MDKVSNQALQYSAQEDEGVCEEPADAPTSAKEATSETIAFSKLVHVLLQCRCFADCVVTEVDAGPGRGWGYACKF